jgi:hypothetical protein
MESMEFINYRQYKITISPSLIPCKLPIYPLIVFARSTTFLPRLSLQHSLLSHPSHDLDYSFVTVRVPYLPLLRPVMEASQFQKFKSFGVEIFLNKIKINFQSMNY